MANNVPINLRIKFKKIGSLQYISHLDLVRTMMKIVTRSHLPLWYTEGFNPKPKMVFAAPLSIGTESVCEYMDLRLSERIDPAIAVAALNANMTDELVALDAYYPETKLTDLKWLGYTIKISTSGADENLISALNTALSMPTMLVKKKAKVGGAEIDIRPLIKSASATLDGGEAIVECVLSADASAFLNPEYVVKYLREQGIVLSSPNLMSEGYSIFRHSAYKADMSAYC